MVFYGMAELLMQSGLKESSSGELGVPNKAIWSTANLTFPFFSFITAQHLNITHPQAVAISMHLQ